MTFQERIDRFYVDYHLDEDPNELIYKYGFFDLIRYDNGKFISLCSEGDLIIEKLRLPNLEIILEEMERKRQ